MTGGGWTLKIDPVTAVDESIGRENIVFIFLHAGKGDMHNGRKGTRKGGRSGGQLTSLDGIVIRIV